MSSKQFGSGRPAPGSRRFGLYDWDRQTLSAPNQTSSSSMLQLDIDPMLPEFHRLVPFGSRRDYVTWVRNVESYLAQYSLLDTIVAGSNCSDQEKALALFYIHLHLNEDFENEFMLERNPLVIWESLREHFDMMKAVELPEAELDWERLRFSNFDYVTAYDSAPRRIVCTLKLCDKEITDDEMAQKTLSTFPPSPAYQPRDAYDGKLWLLGADFRVVAGGESCFQEVTRNQNVNQPRGSLSKGREGEVRVGS